MRRRRLPLLVLLLGLIPQTGYCQSRETVTSHPSYRGRTASAPISAALHVRNEGGSDGSGLCVISSILANGMHQGLPGFQTPGLDELSGRQSPGKGSVLWRTAKDRPGGYSPSKLEALAREVLPGEKYASHVGRDPAVLDRLSREGYPIGATMNTGELYGYRPIHHMVSLLHYRKDEAACVMDNNDDAGVYRWMSSSEFDRRWIDGSVGWAWVWLSPKVRTSLPLLFAALALLLVVGRARRELSIGSHDDPSPDHGFGGDADAFGRLGGEGIDAARWS